MKGPLIHFGIWMWWLIVCGKDKYQACTKCGACYFAWGLPWFGGLSFVSRVWFEESPTNTPFKMLLSNYDSNLQPTPNLHNCRCQKRTAVAICCRRQLSCCPVAPSHPGVHLCAKALGFFFQLQHSSVLWRIASVQLGLIHSSQMHNTDAQVSGLLTQSM